MDFKQLRSFIAVIRYGSFTTAASKLRISQPTVSTHIRQLEEELGMPLVLRNAKRVELTAGGYKVYEQATSMLAMHDKLLQSIHRKDDVAIFVGASSIPSAYILPDLLAGFCAEGSAARFVISQDSSRAVLNGMISGLYELGIVGMCEDEDALEYTPFYHDKIVIAAPNTERFRAVDGTSRKAIAQMLRSERIVAGKDGSATRKAGERILSQIGIDSSSLNVVANSNDKEAMKNLVQSGCGIALLSELAVRDRVKDGRMLAFDVPGVDTERVFFVVKRKNAKLSDAAEAFFDYVIRHGDEASD